MTPAKRLSAPERRETLLGCACSVFSERSYRGTTTAEIARQAGVTEPILYRHFESKRQLFRACLAEVWERVRSTWDRAIAEEPDPAEWVSAMGRAFHASGRERALVTGLWIQSLAESGDDPELAAFMREHMREVHAYVRAVIERAQEEGGVLPDRDPDAEAWLFLAIGLLRIASDRVGGLLEDCFPGIVSSRRRWLVGRA